MPTPPAKLPAAQPPRRGGRQIAASPAQVAEVQQRREAGAVLREIVEDTGLSWGHGAHRAEAGPI